MSKNITTGWIVIGALMISSVLFSGLKYYIHKDYLVVANVECDSSIHSCFVGDGEEAPQSYKIVAKPAYEIPLCNEWSGECAPLDCTDNDLKCSVTYCDPSKDTCTQ